MKTLTPAIGKPAPRKSATPLADRDFFFWTVAHAYQLVDLGLCVVAAHKGRGCKGCQACKAALRHVGAADRVIDSAAQFLPHGAEFRAEFAFEN
jgi:hypothetical protein